jgi:hypothetical protein
MKKGWQIFTVVVFTLSGAWMGWRYVSRRRSGPPPAWLGRIVGSPLVARIKKGKKEQEPHEGSGLDPDE